MTAEITELFPANHSTKPTPSATIDAIMYCVRTRGLAALKESANRARLVRCNNDAREELTKRIAVLLAAGAVPGEAR